MFTAPLFAAVSVVIKKLKLFFYAGLVLLITGAFLKHLMVHLDTALLKHRTKDGITLQSSSSTCGPSALATILRRRGIEVTEKELAKACYSTQTGTEIWYIKRYLAELGIESRFAINKSIPPSYPSIAGIKVYGTGHFISVLNADDDVYTIGDPLYGKKRIESGELATFIHFTGFYLQIIN